MADPFSGRTIDQYEVLEKLGGGGMGVVYRARDRRLHRFVALKFLPPQWAHDADAKARFLREAQAASATDHRNVCTVHDVGETDDGHLFIVMALYAGPTLKHRLQDGPLPIDDALEIATQIAEGLAKAHAAGVVHRDVKPGNVILTEDAVKIVDFGLATFSAAAQLTVEGSTLGTAAYMSPEQSRGEDAGPPSDVWAVGVILYEMLAGHPPFRGASADAIAYAIRHDAPPSLRIQRPDVPEDVERLVFRALMKEPALRFATARELARALRSARGQTLPQDLLSQPIAVPAREARLTGPLPGVRRRRAMWRRAALVGAACAAAAGLGWVVLRPPAPVTVLVAPVANQTGESELDAYRLALTYAMVRDLIGSPGVRPVPYERMLPALRRFARGGADPGSREALQALVGSTGSRLVVMPAILYDDADRTWRGRVEVRDAGTATAVASYETTRVTSALSKETAHAIAREIVGLVNAHFAPAWPQRLVVRDDVSPGLVSIEAERAFEAGTSWYEEQEYGTALAAFETAAVEDRQSALVHAWISRTALVMRRDDRARDAAERAEAVLTDRTSARDRLFVEAVVAEARREYPLAETRLRELRERHPDDVRWILELAGFQDRRAVGREGWMAAIASYHEALSADGGLLRPRLELCRLYNRTQESANARDQGRQAVGGFQAIGWRGGEALARFCLADALRGGTPQERAEARRHADTALAMLEELQFPYNRPRALFYVGLSAAMQGQFREAIDVWERASAAAEAGGNAVLQAQLLSNLGVAHSRLGNVRVATDLTRRSAELYERMGDARRAAELQANGGMQGIVYGLDVSRSVRDVQNALAVFKKLGDADWEVACQEALAGYYRNAGRHEDAERELTRALALARERNLTAKVIEVTYAQARVRFDREEYAATRGILQELVGDRGRAGAAAWTLLARVDTRLGDFDAAQASLAEAEADLERRGDSGLRPQVDVALGELAYDRGQLREARAHWRRALASANPLDEAVVWARACLALLDALDGRTAPAEAAARASVEQAATMGRLSLEAASRVLLARILLQAGRRADALEAVRPVAGDQLGLELRARLHHVRGLAMTGPDGSREAEAARRLLRELREAVPEADRTRFDGRRDVRWMLG